MAGAPAKLGYKFVNPSLSGEEKAAAKSIGAAKPGALPYAKVLLGVNRLGATCNSIYTSVKALKSIEEVRAISLREDEVDERRSKRRSLDQAAEDRVEATDADRDSIKKSGEKEIKKDPKKKKGFLEKIFGPLIDIFNVLSPFINYAAIMGALEWFSDPKNIEKVERLVEFMGEIFKFLYKWGEFGVTNLIDGLGKVFGGVGKFKEGNVLGGAWDTIMGFGQLMVGLLALKGLSMFLNPWKLMGGILDLLEVADKTGASGDCPCGPDGKPTDPDKPNKPKGKKPKTFLDKFKQRVRIFAKRFGRRFTKFRTAVLAAARRYIQALSSRVVAFALRQYYDTIRPAAKRAIAEVLDSVPGKKAVDIVKAVGDKATALRDSAGKLLNKTKDTVVDKVGQATDFAKNQGNRFVSWAKNTKIAQSIRDVSKKVAEGAKNLYKGVISIPEKAKSAWKWSKEWAKKGNDWILQKVLEPLKANIGEFIKKSPILQKLLSLFPKKGAKAGFAKAFNQFADFVKPHLRNLKNTLGPLHIGPLDLAIEAAFALMDLKAGTDPRRVALKLGGSVAGLIAGGAATAALGLGTGGIGAVIAGGVITGVAQWGGEWIGNKIADLMGIPPSPEGAFSTGGIIMKPSFIQVAETEPEVVLTKTQLERLLDPTSRSILPGAENLIGATSSVLGGIRGVPGAQEFRSELSSVAGAFGVQKLGGSSTAAGLVSANASILDLAKAGSDTGTDLNLLSLLSAQDTPTVVNEPAADTQQNPSGTTPSGTTPSGTTASPDTSAPAGPAGPPVTGSKAEKWKKFKEMGSKAGAKWPQLVAAQFALESGWGTALSAQHNYFGIKAAAGESSQSHKTQEVYGGKTVTITAGFKNFPSAQDAVNHLVSQWYKDYKGYKGVNRASSADAAASMLKAEGYATDPSYPPKLQGLMKSNASLATGGPVPIRTGAIAVPSTMPAPGKQRLGKDQLLGLSQQVNDGHYIVYKASLKRLAEQMGFKEKEEEEDKKDGGLFGGLFGGGGGGGGLFGGLFGGGGGGLLGAVGGLIGGPLGAVAGNAVGGLLGGKSLTDVAFGAASSFVPGLGSGVLGKAVDFGKSAFSGGFNPGNIASTAFGAGKNILGDKFGAATNLLNGKGLSSIAGSFGVDTKGIFGKAADALTGKLGLAKLTPMQEWAKNFPELAKAVKPGQSGFNEIQDFLKNKATQAAKDTVSYATTKSPALNVFKEVTDKVQIQGSILKNQSVQKEERDEKTKEASNTMPVPVPVPINSGSGTTQVAPPVPIYMPLTSSLLSTRFKMY